MSMPLAALLALNAVLHGAILGRFGLKGNEPPALFGLLYLVLALAVWLAWPYALWAVLIVVLVGSAGLLANFAKIARDKLLEKAILGVNALIGAVTLYTLLAS